ncbi:MAG TPA: hypothetical protein VGL09_00255 [Methylomirabilota bacterium]
MDATWEFRLPKPANPFDFGTLADVLITVEYTALNSFDYGSQVVQLMDSRLSGDRAFSFRRDFADQWYDLHNPGQSDTPMVGTFRTRREDFPPNLDRLQIQQVLLYFARADGQSFEVPIGALKFREKGTTDFAGGPAITVDGLVSTRRANGTSWMTMTSHSPDGEWQLSLQNQAGALHGSDPRALRVWPDRRYPLRDHI